MCSSPVLGEYQPRPVPDSTPDYDNYCRLYDCNLGRLMTDSMMHWCDDCDFAHVNAGGLRTNLYRDATKDNNVTRGVLSKLMPFGNNYVSYKIQGKFFQETFLKVAATKATAGGFPQFSNLRWAWNPRYESNNTVTTSPRGITAYVAVFNRFSNEWVTLEPQRVYKIATLNFMFTKGAGDGYKIEPTIAYDPFGPPDVDAVIAWMSSPKFKPPPSLGAMRACSNTSYALEDLGDGNLVWPKTQVSTHTHTPLTMLYSAPSGPSVAACLSLHATNPRGCFSNLVRAAVSSLRSATSFARA